MASKRTGRPPSRDWARVVGELLASGESIPEFAGRRGLCRRSLQRWTARLGDGLTAVKGEIVAAPPTAAVPRNRRMFTEVAPPAVVTSFIEIVLPRGLRLRVPSTCDEHAVARLVGALEHAC